MPKKTISLAGEVHISTGSVYTTVDAQEALKRVGSAYGLYSYAEEDRDRRVILEEHAGKSALVIQADISHHGSPLWETVGTITDDPEQIQRYMDFRKVVRMIRQMEIDRERQPAPEKRAPPPKKGPKPYER